jgi:two-component system, OmpR family, sensor kinase
MKLRTRLLLAAAAILAVVSLGALVLLRSQESFLTDQVDDQLQASRPLLGFPPRPVDRSPPEQPDESTATPFSTIFVGYLSDGALVTVLQGELLDDIPDLDTSATAIEDAANGEPFSVDGRQGKTRFRVAVVRESGSDTTSVVALPLDEVDGAMNRLMWTLAGSTAAIAGVLVLAVWWVHRLGLRPVAKVTAAAEAIARGDRDHRVVDADPRTEAGKLASAFNVMLDERDANEDRLRQFVADASHELRTPLTSIRGYLDLYRQGSFRRAGALDDVVRRLSHEATRMHALIEDLLLLARLDQHRPLGRERVDLALVLRDAAADAQVLQPDRLMTVDLPAGVPIETTGDTFRLQQVVGELVTNALVHTEPHVALHLEARVTQRAVEITVADEGPGLQPTDAARVFDRFYRSDQSRARSTGGSGLGLAIARSIVDAHDGTLSLETAPGQGCRFLMTLPRLNTAELARDPADLDPLGIGAETSRVP